MPFHLLFLVPFAFFPLCLVVSKTTEEDKRMSARNSGEPKIKIVLISRSDTGAKTSLATRFVDDRFEERTVSTLRIDLLQKTVTVGGTEVTLMLWGLAHQHKQDTMTRLFTAQNAWKQTHREGRSSDAPSRCT